MAKKPNKKLKFNFADYRKQGLLLSGDSDHYDTAEFDLLRQDYAKEVKRKERLYAQKPKTLPQVRQELSVSKQTSGEA